MTDPRLRYFNFTLVILLCGTVIFIIIIQSEVLSPNKGVKSEDNKRYSQWFKTSDRVSFFTLNYENVLHVTNNRFLSVSIDSSQIHRGFVNPSLTDKKLRKVASHLHGGYLRLGGTAADLVVFTASLRTWPKEYLPLDGGECTYENKSCLEYEKNPPKRFSMSAMDWFSINDFAKATGLKLLFDLNVLLRDHGSWNSSNAEFLLDIAFAQLNEVDWQLGNEPNSFKHTFGVEVGPSHLANDFATLRQLLARYPLYKTSLVVGPDVTRPKRLFLPSDSYLTDFLAAGANVDAITWHHYYTGPNAVLEDFLNPALYDSFRHSCQVMLKAAQRAHVPLKPMWLGETGSAYGGGVVNLSDRFVASLLWADKLGTAAREGIELVIRQSLYRGHYALIDPVTLDPNPDFWISVLYKKLVGHKVLNISYIGDNDDGTLRVYAHCSNQGNPVLFGVNIANSTQGINLTLNTSAAFYSLRGHPTLVSRGVSLNGGSLDLINGELPKFFPVIVSLLDPVFVPPHAVFFLHIYLDLKVCQ